MKKKITWKYIVVDIVVTIVVFAVVATFALYLANYFADRSPEDSVKKSAVKPVTTQKTTKDEPKDKTAESGSPAPSDNTTNQETKAESPSVTTGEQEWREYENSRYSFQIGYPSNYTLIESKNKDGATLTKGVNKVLIFGVRGDNKNLDGFISDNYPSTSGEKPFSNDETNGKEFWQAGDKYIVFQNKNSDFIIISSSNPDEVTATEIDDIAFTFISL